MNYVSGLVGDIASFSIIVGLVMGGISWGVAESHYHSIESTTRIEPELKLTVKDNKVDTIYIYRRK